MPIPAYWRRFIRSHEIQHLFPGYFALVMATGIIGIAAHQSGYRTIAQILLIFNILSYTILWILFFIRLIWYFDAFWKDLTDHNRGPGFFTLIAATNVIGSQLVIQHKLYTPAWYFWLFSLLLWILIIYLFFTAITIKRHPPGIQKGLNGSWLITIVATQSVALLGLFLLRDHSGSSTDIFLFVMICFFLIGCMLYLVMITLILYRFAFYPLQPRDISAPYWIGMGAVAISTLAGSEIINQLPGSIFQNMDSFVRGFTLFFWSFGTWWIPLLLILGVWRHLIHKIPFPWSHNGYHPSYWAMVFPLGMYTVCTHALALSLEAEFLLIIPQYFIFIAFAAWIATFSGLIGWLVVKIFTPPTG